VSRVGDDGIARTLFERQGRELKPRFLGCQELHVAGDMCGHARADVTVCSQ
jgi:hypothetical protein